METIAVAKARFKIQIVAMIERTLYPPRIP